MVTVRKFMVVILSEERSDESKDPCIVLRFPKAL
jgi:hypothetical protein